MFVTSIESLPLELIQNNENQTNGYGPNVSSSGAYHVNAPFLKGGGNYIIRAELVAIDSQEPKVPLVDDLLSIQLCNEIVQGFIYNFFLIIYNDIPIKNLQIFFIVFSVI